MTRAVRLTKQLLTFAKGGDPVKEHIGLADMVEEVARFDLTGSNVSLVYHHDANLWPVDADRGQIQQVVSNLVINARQAMPKGGHLTITLENADLPESSVPTLRAGRYVSRYAALQSRPAAPAEEMLRLMVWRPMFRRMPESSTPAFSQQRRCRKAGRHSSHSPQNFPVIPFASGLSFFLPRCV